MKRLNLGIDFDGVITDPSQLKIDWVKQHYGIELKPDQTNRYASILIIGEEAYRAMIKDCYAGDWAMKNRIRKEATETLRILLDQGHKIYIVTSRTNEQLETALKLMEVNRVPYTAVHNTSEQPKDDLCRRLKIHIFLDDNRAELDILQTIPHIQLVFFNVLSDTTEHNFHEVTDWDEFFRFVTEQSRKR